MILKQGGFGSIYKVFDTVDRKNYAMKFIIPRKELVKFNIIARWSSQ